MNRRGFLRGLLIGAGAVALAPVARVLGKITPAATWSENPIFSGSVIQIDGMTIRPAAARMLGVLKCRFTGPGCDDFGIISVDVSNLPEEGSIKLAELPAGCTITGLEIVSCEDRQIEGRQAPISFSMEPSHAIPRYPAGSIRFLP